MDRYDNILGQIDHRRNILEGYIDQTEAKGYLVSQKYYETLITNEENSLAQLTEKRTQLIESLNSAMENGNIQEYSDSWYEMQSEINDVNEAIQDANTSIIEYGNSIRELQWDVFDKIQDSISNITSEADFLTKLMSQKDMYDDKGNITDQGKATMGMHGVNYNTYMSQADQYRKEMESIQEELSKDPYNQDLIDRRKELLELQQESILAAQDEKDAIKDLVENGINKQLEALKDLIDEYLDALDSQKDMYDYQKKVAKYQEEIDTIRKQISAYKNDDSEEGRANKQKLETSLKEAEENLEETQYEKSIADQKKLLDELYSEYETVLNMRLDNIDILVTDVIGNINSEAAGIRDTIISEAGNVGYQISDSMRTIWTDSSNGIVNAITTYGNNFTSAVTGVQTAINDIKVLIQNAISASDKIANTNIHNANNTQQEQTKPKPSPAPAPKPSTNKGDGVPKVGDAVKFNSGMYYYDSYGTSPAGNQMQGQTVYITYMNPGAPKPIHISRTSKFGERDLGWLSLDQISGYKDGTKSVPKDGKYWVGEGENGKGKSETIIRKKDGAILEVLGQGDKVLNHEASERLWNFANGTGRYAKDIGRLTNLPQTQSNTTTQSVTNDIQVNIGIEKVQDYNDLVRQMQKDKKFERLVQAMTVDQMVGKGKLSKYSIKI